MLGQSRSRSISSALAGRASRLRRPASICGTLLICAALVGCGGSSGKANGSSGKGSGASTKEVSAARTSTTSTKTAPGVVSVTRGGIVATLHATTHTPKANAPWPISFTVTQAGRPAKAKLRYEYLLAGAVVAKRSHYTFTGHFKDVFRWPASSVGYPLTFRAVLKVADKTIYLDYPVKVAR